MRSTGLPVEVLIAVLCCSLAAVLLLMTMAFVIGRSTGKYAVIDALWGPGFALIATVAFLVSWSSGGAAELRWLLLSMVAVWGLRLGCYIVVRNRGLPEDPRYTAMLDDADGPWVIVRRVQVPQGLAMWFVSLPVQLGMLLPGPAGWVVWVGLAVYLVGLMSESVGDAQLATFKGNPDNRGLVLDSGLWRYTRHPNYFGDACVWVGIFLTVTWSWVGWLTILSPVLMIWLLTAKTGKAMTERHLSTSRPGYADYVARTFRLSSAAAQVGPALASRKPDRRVPPRARRRPRPPWKARPSPVRVGRMTDASTAISKTGPLGRHRELTQPHLGPHGPAVRPAHLAACQGLPRAPIEGFGACDDPDG